MKDIEVKTKIKPIIVTIDNMDSLKKRNKENKTNQKKIGMIG